MTFSALIETKELRRALSLVDPTVNATNPSPILRHAVLRVADGVLTVLGTDQVHEVEASVPAVEGEGETTVNASQLNDLARRLPDGSQVALADKGDAIEAKSGRSRVTFPTLPVADFPIKKACGGEPFDIAGPDLEELLSRVQYAQGRKDDREMLNGTYLSVADGRLRASASSGDLWAARDFAAPAGSEDFVGALIHHGTVGVALRIIAGAKEVSLAADRDRVTFRRQGARLTASLIAARPADYEAIFPDLSEPRGVLVDVAELRRAVGIAMIPLEDERHGLSVSFADGALKVALKETNAGEASQDLEAELVGGEPFRFYVGADRFRKVLDALSFDVARMVFTRERGSIAFVSSVAQHPYPERHMVGSKGF